MKRLTNRKMESILYSRSTCLPKRFQWTKVSFIVTILNYILLRVISCLISLFSELKMKYILWNVRKISNLNPFSILKFQCNNIDITLSDSFLDDKLKSNPSWLWWIHSFHQICWIFLFLMKPNVKLFHT